MFLRVLCGKSICAFLLGSVLGFLTTESTEVHREQRVLASVLLRDLARRARIYATWLTSHNEA